MQEIFLKDKSRTRRTRDNHVGIVGLGLEGEVLGPHVLASALEAQPLVSRIA